MQHGIDSFYAPCVVRDGPVLSLKRGANAVTQHVEEDIRRVRNYYCD